MFSSCVFSLMNKYVRVYSKSELIKNKQIKFNMENSNCLNIQNNHNNKTKNSSCFIYLIEIERGLFGSSNGKTSTNEST